MLPELRGRVHDSTACKQMIGFKSLELSCQLIKRLHKDLSAILEAAEEYA